MLHAGSGRTWPSANEYSQAIQNPGTAFDDPALRGAAPARDRLGMPLVMSGNFAYVFKLDLQGGGARAVKCFRRGLGDRARRYSQIDAYLERVSLPACAQFEYDDDGVRVQGQWYPALVMEWIDGPTLDVYVGQLIAAGNAREPLLSLAAQWTELVAALGAAGLAHGDLQHGNVIVTTGGLRLVDLDGMFVPPLAGSGAPDEVGHRHFQHPARKVTDFDATLDRFSALVIHLSLLALAEEPSLWREFHDDNLLFLRSDFEQPGASPLFRRLAEAQGDVQRLARTLEQACRAPLAAVPALSSLVETKKSSLPLWLRDPVVPTLAKQTREVKAGEVAPAGVVVGELRLEPPSPPVTRAAAPAAGGAAGSSWPMPRRRARSAAGFQQTAPQPRWLPWTSGERFARAAVYGIAVAIPAFCFAFAGKWQIPLACVSAATLLGYLRSPRDSKIHFRTKPWGGSLGPLPMPSSSPSFVYGTGAVFGSALYGSFHVPGCAWASRLGVRNRRWFASATEARAMGLFPCPHCSP